MLYSSEYTPWGNRQGGREGGREGEKDEKENV